MRHTRYVVLAIAALIPVMSALAQGSPPAPDLSLRPGDAIRIAVWRKPEYSGEFTISYEGAITHPFYQQLRVTGMAVSDVRRLIGDHLARFEAQPLFVVEPLLRVTVGGEVNRPGLYTLTPETSVAQAVAAGGGVAELGRPDRVQLFREGRAMHVDLTKPEPGNAQMPIRSGDQIYVARRSAVFREYILPVVSIAGAAAAIVNVVLRNR
jgi:protein involved in polysaccharide export with SLBB domain